MKRDYALGARIKAAMKAAGFATAREFCEKHHVPYLTFAQHIQGRRLPAPSFLKLYGKSFGVTEQWLETGEGHPMAHAKGSKNKKIEAAFTHEINKCQTDLMLNAELLTAILEEIIRLKLQYKLSEKKCADIATNLYTQIIKTTCESDLQKNIVSAFVKTYEASLDN